MKKAALFLCLVAIFLAWSNNSYAQCTPPNVNFINCFRTSISSGAPLAATDAITLAENIGGWLIIIAGIVAGIVIIVAGLVYMSAGSNQQRVASAKAIFKNGVVGALILFASGIIINTIILIAVNWRNFFS